MPTLTRGAWHPAVSRDPSGGNDSAYPAFHLGRKGSEQYLRVDNYMAGDIHRLVTLGTPFQGSPLANDVYLKLAPTQENIQTLRNLTNDTVVGKLVTDTFFGGNASGPYVPPTAAADLRSPAGATKSQAIAQLNTNATFPADDYPGVVKWHAIYGLVTPTVTDYGDIRENVVWDVLRDIVQAKLGVNLAIPPDSDLIVPTTSARDGLTKQVGSAPWNIREWSAVRTLPD